MRNGGTITSHVWKGVRPELTISHNLSDSADPRPVRECLPCLPRSATDVIFPPRHRYNVSAAEPTLGYTHQSSGLNTCLRNVIHFKRSAYHPFYSISRGQFRAELKTYLFTQTYGHF